MAQRATSLGPKPSLFVFVSFLFFVFSLFFCFLVFAFARKKPCFPQERAFFVYFFCVSLCFSLAFFGPPPFFPFLFLCLSLVLFFLPSFLFFICSFWFLFFLFVVFVFLFQDDLLFLFFCLLSCVVLNHTISFIFPLPLVF